MAKTRGIKKYDISKHRYMEMVHYCLQYPEWKDALELEPVISGGGMDGMPKGGPRKDKLEELAIRRSKLSGKCRNVERAAELAAGDLKKYIIIAVTREGMSYDYLRTRLNIPCGRRQFYEYRRKFFWILSGMIDEK